MIVRQPQLVLFSFAGGCFFEVLKKHRHVKRKVQHSVLLADIESAQYNGAVNLVCMDSYGCI